MNEVWVGDTLEHRRLGESQIQFRWPETRCGIDLKNLRQDDGHIYADVHAYVGSDRRIVRPKVNVTSDRSIPSLVKALTKATEEVNADGQMRSPCDWSIFLDSMVAVLVDGMDQKGEPTWLAPLEGHQLAQPMLFRNFVPAGLLSGLVAHGGVGKSLTGMLMALAISTGRTIGPFEPMQQGKVLYADWENQSDLHARRMTRICRGLEIPFPIGQILHYRARGKLVQAEAELVEMAIENKVILTIFDSIGFASGGNLNDSDVATAAVNAIKHVPETKVMIAHVTKAAAEGTTAKAPSGSAFYWNGPQALYDLQASAPDDKDGSVVLTIYQSKANAGARLQRPLGIRVEFHDDDGGGPIVPMEYTIEGHKVGGESMPERARVIDYLRSVSMPVNALTIAEALYDDADKGKVDGINATLRKLRTAGVAENVNEGATGRGNTGTWRISQASAPLSVGKVDDSDKCARCGSLRIACFDANNTPLCEAHKATGEW